MKFFVFLFLCLLLASCAPVYANKTSFDQNNRLLFRESAKSGDPEAQYLLGNTYCCGKNSFWNTDEAIKWWCKAAVQGHKKALQAIKEAEGNCEN